MGLLGLGETVQKTGALSQGTGPADATADISGDRGAHKAREGIGPSAEEADLSGCLTAWPLVSRR